MQKTRRTLFALALLLAVPLATTGPIWAVCGGYGPQAPPPPEAEPPGTIPGGSIREPFDPPPPPPEGPTTPGGETDGPTTPTGGDLDGPTTGGPDSDGPTTGTGPVTAPGGTSPGPTTGDGGLGGPTTGGGRRPGRAGASGGGLDVGHWSYWWYANRAVLLDDDLRVRSNSAARTGKESAPETAPLWRASVRRALAAALSDDDDEVVAAAVLALGKGGDAADIPIVRDIAVDAKRGAAEREHAAVALGLLGADSPRDAAAARTALQTVASDKQSSTRLRALAVLALGMRGDEAAVPFLIDCARSGGRAWDVPAAGLTALGMSGCEAAREELERLLAPPKRGNDRMRRVYAAHGLAKLGDTAALPALFAALEDDTKDVRRAAALAVGAIAPEGDRGAVRALARVLRQDKDRGARSMAAVALGRIGGDEALLALRSAYDEDDAPVRPFAALGLGVLARNSDRPRLVAPLLRDLQRGARQELRGAICVAIGIARLGAAAPDLRRIVEDEGNPQVVAHAALALGMIGDREKGPELLRALLRDSNDNVLRGEVARALGMLGDVRTLVELDDMADHGGTEHERIVGCLGLGRVGGSECATLLTSILADEKRSQLERHMAGNALGLLIDPTSGRRTGNVAADLDWYLFTPTVIDVLTEM